MKKAKVNDKMVDVISFEQYCVDPNGFDINYTAVQMDNGLLYPIRGKNSTAPGIYNRGATSKFVQPDEDNKQSYSSDSVIDLRDTNMRNIIEKKNKLRTMEDTILSIVDEVYAPVIKENDSPLMRGLKEGITEKKADLQSYEHRFIDKNNEKRLLNNSTITLGKLVTILDVFDMKATVIIEDKHPNVPNPIGKKIIVNLNDGDE